VIPKGFSIIHIGRDELDLLNVICTTLYGIDLVSLVLYIYQFPKHRCNLPNAKCINLQGMNVNGFLGINNNIM